ncbi:uncharacterized protein LOC119986892 [Tripterygium wilfordii]|uniref:uncharacterized protein LOC119986892 n=1 Tax=Tripterygium wilfordii TaxID=458696 RepID=UPI0018F854D8|nr:uncharacterized protein LOC119986892 [Tripterygium wilfordii]
MVRAPVDRSDGQISRADIKDRAVLKPGRELYEMEQLRKINPPEFSGEGEGLEAGEWLCQMSRRLETLRFVPRSFQVDKAKQYLDLVQTPEMTVSQYTKKYEEFYKYGKKYAPDDESKTEKYRDGLLLSIGRMVIASRVRTYDETVDMALELERGERSSRQYWDVQKGHKASTISGSRGGSLKKPKTEFQGLRGQKIDQGKCSGPRDGKIVCFKCGWEGHKKNQCTIMGVKCYGCGMVGHRKHEYPRGGRAPEQSQAWVYHHQFLLQLFFLLFRHEERGEVGLNSRQH